MTEKRMIHDWEKYYQDEKVETMPWFLSGLDPDLEKALQGLDIKSATFLDLGTGPGTQAMAMAERGFKVTATDLSDTAVKKAIIEAKKRGLDINFIQDDILKTKLKSEFDLVFDRGCFHVHPPERREDYVRIIEGLIKPGGYIFLKCFSHREVTVKGGPYRFRPEEIRSLFSKRLDIMTIDETVYHGTMNPLPLALFCVIKKPAEGPARSCTRSFQTPNIK